MKLPYIKLLQNLDLMLQNLFPVGRRGNGWYMVTVGRVFDAVMGSAETVSVHSILDGRSHDDLDGWSGHSLWCPLVVRTGGGKVWSPPPAQEVQLLSPFNP